LVAELIAPRALAHRAELELVMIPSEPTLGQSVLGEQAAVSGAGVTVCRLCRMAAAAAAASVSSRTMILAGRPEIVRAGGLRVSVGAFEGVETDSILSPTASRDPWRRGRLGPTAHRGIRRGSAPFSAGPRCWACSPKPESQRSIVAATQAPSSLGMGLGSVLTTAQTLALAGLLAVEASRFEGEGGGPTLGSCRRLVSSLVVVGDQQGPAGARLVLSSISCLSARAPTPGERLTRRTPCRYCVRALLHS
jgi:hypothetical protein